MFFYLFSLNKPRSDETKSCLAHSKNIQHDSRFYIVLLTLVFFFFFIFFINTHTSYFYGRIVIIIITILTKPLCTHHDFDSVEEFSTFKRESSVGWRHLYFFFLYFKIRVLHQEFSFLILFVCSSRRCSPTDIVETAGCADESASSFRG